VTQGGQTATPPHPTRRETWRGRRRKLAPKVSIRHRFISFREVGRNSRVTARSELPECYLC